MSLTDPPKLIPRNAAALRQGQSGEAAIRPGAGNPVTTRLEDGVGNCFPGLECDLRNLDRRFFPHLAVDFRGGMLTCVVAEVDLASVPADHPDRAAYERLTRAVADGEQWSVVTLEAPSCGLLRLSEIAAGSLRPRGIPDAWTAVRRLKQGEPIVLEVERSRPKETLRLTGPRVAYFDADGAL